MPVDSLAVTTQDEPGRCKLEAKAFFRKSPVVHLLRYTRNTLTLVIGVRMTFAEGCVHASSIQGVAELNTQTVHWLTGNGAHLSLLQQVNSPLAQATRKEKADSWRKANGLAGRPRHSASDSLKEKLSQIELVTEGVKAKTNIKVS